MQSEPQPDQPRDGSLSDRAASVYVREMERPLPQHKVSGRMVSGFTDGFAGLDAGLLYEHLAPLIRDPGTAFLKKEPGVVIFRIELENRQLLVKGRFPLKLKHRIKSGFRPSPARRAYAAGRALLEAGFRTPEPIAWLDVAEESGLESSWLVTEWLEHAQDARSWLDGLKPNDKGLKSVESFLNEAVTKISSLADVAIYHPDTKASNFLLTGSEADVCGEMAWIDLEGVSFRTPLTPRRAARNLVQMNGSLPVWVNREIRNRFISRFVSAMPCGSLPFLKTLVYQKTRWRLFKERVGLAGP